MAQVIGNSQINIVQGDDYLREITLEGVDSDFVEGIYFTCKKLGVCKKLTFEQVDNTYTLYFTGADTLNMLPGAATYDMTIKFIDSSMKTLQYCSKIEVLEKINRVCCL